MNAFIGSGRRGCGIDEVEIIDRALGVMRVKRVDEVDDAFFSHTHKVSDTGPCGIDRSNDHTWILTPIGDLEFF
jgi:hypothetical protein